jgi:hypothetical protein
MEKDMQTKVDAAFTLLMLVAAVIVGVGLFAVQFAMSTAKSVHPRQSGADVPGRY